MVLPGVASVQTGPGALQTATEVSVAIVAAPQPLPVAAVSEVVEFLPHGISFAIPAKLSLRHRVKAPGASLHVLRLADPSSQTWEPVGGVRFTEDSATFESTTFSYYVVTEGFTCTPAPIQGACTSSCNCCGGPTCVDLTRDPDNCGACGRKCGAGSFCTGTRCETINRTEICNNKKVISIQGELPDLTVQDPAQAPDSIQGALIAAAIGSRCGITPTAIAQSAPGALDPCNDAPLMSANGTTLVIAGGAWAQRVARYIDRGLGPVVAQVPGGPEWAKVTTKAGTKLLSLTFNDFSASHDYFIVSLSGDTARGSLLLHVYGFYLPGTLAATWYFNNVLLRDLGTLRQGWSSYRVYEWTDTNGNQTADAGDTFRVVAQDVP